MEKQNHDMCFKIIEAYKTLIDLQEEEIEHMKTASFINLIIFSLVALLVGIFLGVMI